MSTAAAKLANERKAAAIEADLIEAMRYSPEGMHLSSGECARFLATASGLAPEGSLKIYLQLYRKRGDDSKFYRMFASKIGPALTRHNAMHPNKLGVWCNRDGPPPEPVEPAPPPPADPEPVEIPPTDDVEPAPETMYWADSEGPEPARNRIDYSISASRHAANRNARCITTNGDSIPRVIRVPRG